MKFFDERDNPAPTGTLDRLIALGHLPECPVCIHARLDRAEQ